MSAFNARLRPKAIFGLPLYSVASATLMLPLISLAILVPVTVIKILLGLAGLVCLGGAIFFLVVGDELPFLRVRWQARQEAGSVTTETGGF